MKVNKQPNSVALSMRAKYTDGPTATCWRNLVSTFVDRGVSRGQRGGSPTVVNLSFLDRSRYFSFKYLLTYPLKGWVDPVPDPLLLRKSGIAWNRTRDHRDHRGGRTKVKHGEKWDRLRQRSCFEVTLPSWPCNVAQHAFCLDLAVGLQAIRTEKRGSIVNRGNRFDFSYDLWGLTLPSLQ
jgi:hypothetical protein